MAENTSIFDSYDCIDIGSDANSISWTRQYLDVKFPIGINIEKSRIENLISARESCMQLNCFDIPKKTTTDYVFLSHMIEHLENREQVIEIIRRSLKWARKGIYISGPAFLEDEFVRNFGVKFTWGDWTDHSSRFDLRSFMPFLRKQDFKVSISLGWPVADSSADDLVALMEKHDIDSFEKDGSKEKPSVTFPRDVYQEYLVMISCNGSDFTHVHDKRHGTRGLQNWSEVQADYKAACDSL